MMQTLQSQFAYLIVPRSIYISKGLFFASVLYNKVGKYYSLKASKEYCVTCDVMFSGEW